MKKAFLSAPGRVVLLRKAAAYATAEIPRGGPAIWTKCSHVVQDSAAAERRTMTISTGTTWKSV
jgi:hypothetical protein